MSASYSSRAARPIFAATRVRAKALARPHLVARLRRLVSHGRALTRAVAEAGTRLEQRKTELMRKLHGN